MSGIDPRHYPSEFKNQTRNEFTLWGTGDVVDYGHQLTAQSRLMLSRKHPCSAPAVSNLTCLQLSKTSFSLTSTMLLLGLTGSIATGKSTVSAILSQPPYSLPIIDADLLARKVVEPGTSGYRKIISHFSSTTPDLLLPSPGNGSTEPPLNRAALGRRVFGDSEDKKKDRAVLNGIVHPAVRRAIYKQLMSSYVRGCWAVVLDVPLLFESGLDVLCGTMLVVAVHDPIIQMKRLRERDPHLSAEEAESRVKSQGDVRDKAKRCEARGSGRGVVVWNDHRKEELRIELANIMKEVGRQSPRWWSGLLLLCPPLAGVTGLWSILRTLMINRRWRNMELQG